MRRDARDAVYKLLFANMFNDGLDEPFIKAVFKSNKLNKEDAIFAKKLLDTIQANYDETYSEIVTFAKNYNADRIYYTDKCALLIAMTEIKYFDDVPNVVAIDEAVALTAKYSTDKSLAFVNGILAEYKKYIEGNK